MLVPRKTARPLLLGVALGLGASAQAATLFDRDLATGPLASPDSRSIGFAAGSGAGRARVEVLGFNSLDGVNGYIDVFTLALNGENIFAGSFNLGGGGGNQVFLAPAGTQVDAHYNGWWQGGTLNLDLPLAFRAGNQLLSFSYAGNPQGLGDEGWGLGRVTVSGVAAGAVPEPASWALLITGFGLVGASLRRRRTATLAAQ